MTIQPAFIPPGYLSLAPISDPAVVVLNFKNESPHFMSVKMLDYAQWLQSGNEKESMVFELNVREKDVKKQQRFLIPLIAISSSLPLILEIFE